MVTADSRTSGIHEKNRSTLHSIPNKVTGLFFLCGLMGGLMGGLLVLCGYSSNKWCKALVVNTC